MTSNMDELEAWLQFDLRRLVWSSFMPFRLIQCQCRRPRTAHLPNETPRFHAAPLLFGYRGVAAASALFHGWEGDEG